MRYFGLFVWLLVTVLVLSYLSFHYPEFDNWKPQTFTQFVVVLFGGLSWFIVGLLAECKLGG
jgi:tellurite resistance protein TehA-like permease